MDRADLKQRIELHRGECEYRDAPLRPSCNGRPSIKAYVCCHDFTCHSWQQGLFVHFHKVS